MLSTQAVWFPLRSNLVFFETGPKRLSLEGRVKEMAILCDELYFEDGLVTCDVSEHTVFGPIWHSPEQCTDEFINEIRSRTKKGTPFTLSIGEQPAPGVSAPAEAMRVIGGGMRQRAFVAEYRQLLTRTGLAETSWANLAVPYPEHQARVDELATQIRYAYTQGEPRLSKNGLLDSSMKTALNHDLAVGAVHGTPIVVDTPRGRVIAHRAKYGQLQGLPGAEALSLWIPDFSGKKWDDIIALHDHDAIGSFRAKLQELESEAAGLTGKARAKAIRESGAHEVAEALRKRFPSLRRRISNVALDVVAGLALGPFAPIVGGIREVADAQSEATEWTAVYLELTKQSAA